MIDINLDLLRWFINSLKKNFWGTVNNAIISNKHLAEELHRPVIRKFKKGKVHSSSIDNIQGEDLQLQ